MKYVVLDLEIDPEGHLHDAFDDARNTASVMRVLSDREELEAIKERRRKEEEERHKPCSCTLGSLFDFSVFLTAV